MAIPEFDELSPTLYELFRWHVRYYHTWRGFGVTGRKFVQRQEHDKELESLGIKPFPPRKLPMPPEREN